MTLSWNPPVNIKNAEEVSEYQIRYKQIGEMLYNEMTVRDSCTASIDFTQGLVSSKNYRFEVRARNDCGKGEWVKASAFCGMYLSDITPLGYKPLITEQIVIPWPCYQNSNMIETPTLSSSRFPNEASVHRPVKEFTSDRKCVREWHQPTECLENTAIYAVANLCQLILTIEFLEDKRSEGRSVSNQLL